MARIDLIAPHERHPRALSGGSLELSRFSIHYRDRIVTPITYNSQALTNPAYSNRVTLDPDEALVDQLVGSASHFVNGLDTAYDPAAVAVIVDNRNVNAGRQLIHGIDALFRYGPVWARPTG